jgi:hypothetical protein
MMQRPDFIAVARHRTSVRAFSPVLFLLTCLAVPAAAHAQAGACVLVPDPRNPPDKILRCGSSLTIKTAAGTIYGPPRDRPATAAVGQTRFGRTSHRVSCHSPPADIPDSDPGHRRVGARHQMGHGGQLRPRVNPGPRWKGQGPTAENPRCRRIAFGTGRRCDRCDRTSHRQAVGAPKGKGVARPFWSMIQWVREESRLRSIPLIANNRGRADRR